MRKALRRAVCLTWSPREEWLAIRNEAPDSRSLLWRFVLPMSCIPAGCWMLGLALFGGRGVVAPDEGGLGAEHVLHGGAIAFLGSVGLVLLLAVALLVLSPLFTRNRDWARCLQVAAFSFAPVFLSGVLLAMPDLVFVATIAAAHGFYLQYIGVQRVLGVKEGDAAEYVALVVMLFMMGSTLVGVLGSWLGLM